MMLFFQTVECVCGNAPNAGYTTIWVGVITAVSAMVGVGIAGYIAFRTKKSELGHAANESNRTIAIARLEELHGLVTSLIWDCNRADTAAVLFRHSARGERPDIHEPLERLKATSPKISSLLMVHTPELNEQWISLRERLWNFSNEAEGYANGGLLTRENLSLMKVEVVNLVRALELRIRNRLRTKLGLND